MKNALALLLFFAVSASAQNTYNVLNFGCDRSGQTDSADCFNRVLGQPDAFAVVYVPAGTYVVQKPLQNIVKARQIRGDGSGATRIVFNVAVNGSNGNTLFPFHMPADNGTLDYCGVEKLTIEGHSSLQKTAISTYDAGNFTARDLQIFFTGNADDRGLYIGGRHESLVDNVGINAATPIVLAGGRNRSVDHWTFSNLSLYGMHLEKPLISVAKGANLSNVTFTGRQVWVGGYHGFHWDDETSEDAIGINLRFENIRWENGDAQIAQVPPPIHGFMFYIAPKRLSRLSISNVYGGSVGAQGLFLRRSSMVTLTNFAFDGEDRAGITQLDVDESNDHLTVIGFALGNNPSAKRVIKLDRIVTGERLNTNGGDVFPFAYYAKRKESPYQGRWESGVFTWKHDLVLQPNGSIDLPSPGYVGPVRITASAQHADRSDLTAEYCAWGANHYTVTLLPSTARCSAGKRVGYLSLDNNGGAMNPLTLRNELSVPLRVVISLNE